MNGIGILVGQDADLPDNLIKNLPVDIFPFIVNWKGYDSMRKTVKDGRFYAAKTSQPSKETFYTLFAKNLKIYQEIIVITISSSLSGTYNSALRARELFEDAIRKRIHIVDSQTSTASEGLLVLKAAELVRSNKTINEILEILKKDIADTHLLGVFDDPIFLQKGGRISNVKAIVIRNLLKAGFRPILTIKNGKIVTKKIKSNSKDKANSLILQFKEDVHSVILNEVVNVAITHADCLDDANKLKNLVANYNKNITIKYIHTISPVVGSHLGPDSLIISWMVSTTPPR